jgi:integrase
MASQPRQLPSGRWQVEWRVTGGRGSAKRYQTFDTKTQARAFKAQVEADLSRGVHVDPREGRITVKDYAAYWLTLKPRAPGTMDAYRNHLARILPVIGARQIGQVRPVHLRELLASLRALGWAESTVSTSWGITGSIFRSAVNEGVITASPCDGLSVDKPRRKEVRVLDGDQLTALIAATPERDLPVLLTAIGTGLRQGELLGLRASRVDFLRRTLSVEEQVTSGTGRPAALTSVLKTNAARRRIPLPDELLEVLSPFVVGRDVLFTRPRSGGLWRRDHFNAQIWKPALRAAKLDDTLGIHVLRHTYVSHLIAAGRNPKAIQRLMGHASITETLDTYGHLFPDDDDQTRAVMSGLLGQMLRSTDRSGSRDVTDDACL